MSHLPKVAPLALFAATMAYLIASYPLVIDDDTARLDAVFVASQGLALLLCAGVIWRRWRKLRGPASFPQLIVMVFIAGDLGAYVWFMLGHYADLGEGWPGVRVCTILMCGFALCLIFWKWSIADESRGKPS